MTSELTGFMADSRAEAKKIKDKTGVASCVARD